MCRRAPLAIRVLRDAEARCGEAPRERRIRVLRPDADDAAGGERVVHACQRRGAVERIVGAWVALLGPS